MTDGQRTAYDQVLYPGQPFDKTHPDRLATIASLFGMTPAPIARCRVLELGCGNGANLIPMAYQWPEAEFVGFDLSTRAIVSGNEDIAALGLDNVTLQQRDIMDLSPEAGRFDYIIAHGVYSWVPSPVRAKVLSIYRHNLAPDGVAYVSYNAHPGSYLRDMARRMMLMHVEGMPDPEERIGQARALLQGLAELSSDKTAYGVALREQLDRVKRMSDHTLYHDDLDVGAEAFFLQQVATDAAREGLQYLSEARFARSSFGDHPERIAEFVAAIPAERVVMREQYLDFLLGRGFRETLLCHAEIALRRDLDPQCVRHYHIAGSFETDPGIDPVAPGAVTFKSAGSASITTDHLLSKAALFYLGKVWPEAISFPDLVAASLALIGDAAGHVAAHRDEETAALAAMLFRAYRADRVHFHLYPPRVTHVVSERPQASLLARRQAGRGTRVVTMRHQSVTLNDPVVRRFLPLVDGTRTVDQLVADLSAAIAEMGTAAREDGTEDGKVMPSSPATRDDVVRNLRTLASHGLLVS